MKAILIDPFAKAVTEVEYSGDFHDIYKLLDCHTFDCVYIKDGDTLYVDDEGLFKGSTEFFWHRDYPQPLAGKALVLGVDVEGESVSPVGTLEHHRSRVQFVRPLRIGEKVAWLPAA